MSESTQALPDGLISYGPDSNCTITLCPLEASVYRYRPSLGANVFFLVAFSLLGALHLWRGLRWRNWTFTSCMAAGCAVEVVGYGGRVMLWRNPFSFAGFLLQICLITCAPVFYCAAIYVLLGRVVVHLDAALSRFPPRLWWIAFLAADVFSLVLQSVGGALSSTSSGESGPAIPIAVAGLSLQVVTLFVFSVACADYARRYTRKHGTALLSKEFKVFVAALALAVVFIFIRCAYRIEELREGYRSALISNQGLFIALEGVMVVVAVVALLWAHPGPAFQTTARQGLGIEKGVESCGEEEVKVAAGATQVVPYPTKTIR